MVRRTKDGTRRFICLVFLRGIRERAGDTWYPYRHHLIEAKQSDETNKREGMRAPSRPFFFLPTLSLPFGVLGYSRASSSRLYRAASRISSDPYERNPRCVLLSRLGHLRPRSSYSDLGRWNTCANSERRRDRWTRR